MNHAQAAPGAPAVRVSDAERDKAAEILRAGYAEGRLSRAELDERIGTAYGAKTRADLRDLTSDLPGTVSAGVERGRPAPGTLPIVDPGFGAGRGPDLCLPLCLLSRSRRLEYLLGGGPCPVIRSRNLVHLSRQPPHAPETAVVLDGGLISAQRHRHTGLD